MVWYLYCTVSFGWSFWDFFLTAFWLRFVDVWLRFFMATFGYVFICDYLTWRFYQLSAKPYRCQQCHQKHIEKWHHLPIVCLSFCPHLPPFGCRLVVICLSFAYHLPTVTTHFSTSVTLSVLVLLRC